MKKNRIAITLALLLTPTLIYSQSFYDKCKVNLNGLVFKNRLALGEALVESNEFPYSEMRNLTEQQAIDFLNGRKVDAITLLKVNYYEELRDATPREIKQSENNSSGSGKKLLSEVTGIKAINSTKPKKEEETIVSNGKIWSKKYFKTFTNRPFILVSSQIPIDNEILKPRNKVYGSFEYEINLPPGITPINDLGNFDKKKMTLEKEIENSNGTTCYILTDNTNRLYLFMTYKQATNVLTNIKLSNDIENIRDEFKKEKLVLRQGKTFQGDMAITNISQNRNSIIFNLKINTDERIIEVPINNERELKGIFYNKDCYEQSIVDFNNQMLPNDYFSDNALKNKLIQAFAKSLDWSDFELIKLILTSQSLWRQHKGRFEIVTEGRAMTAYVFVKSKTTGECFVDKEIYFYQRNDAIQGFIFPIEVASTPNLKEFPCKK